MRVAILREASAYGLAAGQFFLMALAFALFVEKGFTFAEFTTTLSIIGPIFASHISIALRQVAKTKFDVAREQRHISRSFAVMTITFGLSSVAFVALAMFLKATNRAFESFEQLKITIAIFESLLGVHLGFLIKSLYD